MSTEAQTHDADDGLDVAAMKTELLDRRQDLAARQERVARHTRHREEALPADFAEQAIELENGETLVALDREITDELKRVDQALARIEAGTYQQCARCGRNIGSARLKALPDTIFCIDCASAAA